MGQALEMCVRCENKRGCDLCTDLHEWIMEHLEMENELKAYKDTGLEPEDIMAAVTPDALIKLASQALGVQPERLRELVKAEKDGRIKILPQSESGNCGSCGHFKRIPGRRCGTCEVRPHWTNRRGQIDEHRGVFIPSQSRKACKQYFAREEAEAALDLEGGANMTDGDEKPYDPDWKKCMMQKFVGRR